MTPALLGVLGMFLVVLSTSCEGGTQAVGLQKGEEGSGWRETAGNKLAFLNLLSGDGQDAEVGSPVAEPLVVEVRTEKQKPAPDVEVRWEVTRGGGSLGTTTTLTDTLGRARQPDWVLGTVAGAQGVKASVKNLGSVAFGAAAIPGPATGVILFPEEASIQLRESLAMGASAEDQYGNAIPEPDAWSSSDPEVATVDSKGVVTGHLPGSVNITVTYDDASASAQVTVKPRPPAKVTKTGGKAQLGTVGQPANSPLTVEVRDTLGELAPGVPVNWTVTQGGGSLFFSPPSGTGSPSGSSGESSLREVTDVQGGSKVYWVFGPQAGTQTATAQAEGDGVVVFVASVEAGNAASVSVSPNEASLHVGSNVQLSATAQDDYGNPVSESAVWSSADPGVASVDAGTGRVTGEGAGSTAITATVGDAQGSAEITVISSVPASITPIGGQNQTGAAGMPLAIPLEVEVRDGGGTPIPGLSVEWFVVDGGGSVSASATQTNQLGRAEVIWILGTTPGENEAEARVQGLPAVSFSVTGEPGPVAEIPVSPSATSVQVGQTVSLLASPQDAFGNEVSATVSWSSLDESVAVVSSSGVVTGVADGTAEIRAAVGGTTGTATVTVISTSPSQILATAGNGQTGTVGSTLSTDLEVVVKDDQGTPLEGIAVQWEVRTGGGSLSSTSTLTDVSGEAGVSWVLGTTAGFQRVRATANGLSPVSFSATAKPGSVTSVTVSPDPVVMTVGTSETLSATATDEYGNPTSALLSWDSFDDAVATFQGDGPELIGVSPGTTTISASAGGVSATVPVTVNDLPDPGAVTDLTAASTTNSSVTLRWTEVDNGLGEPADYALRYGTPTLSWGEAYPTEVTISGTAVGSTREYTWQGLDPDTPYEFRLVTYRGTLNVDAEFGPLSNTASATTDATDLATPDQILGVSGNEQVDTVGATVSDPLVVEVRNGNGDPLQGIQVGWSVVQGGGSISPASSGLTGSDGRNSAVLTLGNSSGTNVCQAQVAGVGSVQFTATANPGAVTSINVSPNPKTIEVGKTQTFSAVARDGSGNIVSTSFTWASSDPGVALALSNPGAVAGVSVGTATISAAAGDVTGSASLNVVSSSSPTLTIVSGNNQTDEVGSTLSQPLVVQLEDGQGQPAEGVAITWNVVVGGGSVTASSTTTDHLGQAEVGWTLGPTPGVQRVSATRSGVGSVEFLANVEVGPVANVNVAPSSATIGVGSVRQFTAQASDEYGNQISGVSFTWSSSNGSVASVNSSGFATGLAAGSTTIRATGDGVTGTASLTVLSSGGGGGNWPNEPAGLALLSDRAVGDAEDEKWIHVGQKITTESDVSAPLSPPFVKQFHYLKGDPAPTPGGGITTFNPADKLSEVFVGFWIKLVDPWDEHASGVSPKIVFIRDNGTGGGGDPLVVIRRPSGEIRAVLQNGGSPPNRSLRENVGISNVPVGEWHKIEIYTVTNSDPSGVIKDGEFHMWVDGVKTTEYTDIWWSDAATPGWDLISFQPLWGGQGDTLQHDNFLRIDHFYISGR